MRTCRILDFAVTADYREKCKENEKRNKYEYFARGLKNLRNMRVALILIVIVALVTVPKGMEKKIEELEIGGGIETI